MARRRGSGQFDDRPQSAFTLASDAATSLVRLALGSYRYRCAMTGEQFHPEPILPHPHLDVVPIQPLVLDGPQEIGNCLVLEENAARAFRRGLIQVSDDFRIIVPAPDRLDARLAPHVTPMQPLHLPEDPILWPHPARLAFHRALFANGPGTTA